MSVARNQQADALIGEMRRHAAGRLTLFLGAAPGVGKTYAMLSRARELQKQGVDVVAGIVETHGRADTAALLDGLAVLPRMRLPHKGYEFDELDLDGLLARKPQLALVDELAHRNVPGGRHERRWQDVVELLDAGIDVYTTINIQHLESLNDVVYRITHVRVTETVPDAMFDRLRDIVLVDLPPRELIERLKQGKVYLPEQADQAMQAFFTPSNLAALRELAMQTAADRVDLDLRELQTARGLPGVALRRRVLVAIDGLGQSDYLVRIGRRIAERRDAPWSVVHVQRAGGGDDERQLEIDRAFALARRLGADTEVLRGGSIVAALLDHAGRAGASAIVIGRTRERPWARLFNRTLTQQLLQHGTHVELTVVSTPQARARARRRGRDGNTVSWLEPAFAIGATLAATALAWFTEGWLGLEDLSMVFIVAVVLVASRTRMRAAVATAVLCFFAYNYFFIEPRYTLLIGARQGVTTVLLFLGAALIAGRLAAQLRLQVLALRASNAHAHALQALGRQLASAGDLADVLRVGHAALERELQALAWLRVDGVDVPADASSLLAETDRAAADWAQRHHQVAGRYTDTLAGSAWWFLPMQAATGVSGVVGLRFDRDMPRLALEQHRLAEAMADDIAQAAARTRLVADLESARITGETERLRSALLSSVSHDLRSPLAAMIGAADSLADPEASIAAAERDELLAMIRLEGERLDRYIQNLLDMTRLGHQGLTLRRDWIGVDELIGAASQRLQRYLPTTRFAIRIAAELPPIHVHPALIEQAIFNVLENAAKFSPAGIAIGIEVAEGEPGQVRIDISDAGPGIPDDERRRIFDMFYSVERGDRGRHGTGLGLAICQGIVGAHMGGVAALPGPDGIGTTIRITLPIGEPPPQDAAVEID